MQLLGIVLFMIDPNITVLTGTRVSQIHAVCLRKKFRWEKKCLCTEYLVVRNECLNWLVAFELRYGECRACVSDLWSDGRCSIVKLV